MVVVVAMLAVVVVVAMLAVVVVVAKLAVVVLSVEAAASSGGGKSKLYQHIMSNQRYDVIIFTFSCCLPCLVFSCPRLAGLLLRNLVFTRLLYG